MLVLMVAGISDGDFTNEAIVPSSFTLEEIGVSSLMLISEQATLTIAQSIYSSTLVLYPDVHRSGRTRGLRRWG